jgi:hypothetical protein
MMAGRRSRRRAPRAEKSGDKAPHSKGFAHREREARFE